jgi:hypothetical protein
MCSYFKTAIANPSHVAIIVVRLYERIRTPAIRRNLGDLRFARPAEQRSDALGVPGPTGLPTGRHVHLSAGITSEST